MKHNTFLLFMGVLIQIAAFTTYAQADCEPATITKVKREGVGNRITWKMPPNGEEVTITQGGNYNDNGVGVGAWNQTKSVGVYHRYAPEHLAAISGGELTQIVFVPMYNPGNFQYKPGHTYTIQIYEGGSWGEEEVRNPGTLIASQELVNDSLLFNEENTITLKTPITINASHELWLGYFCTDIDTVQDLVKTCAGADKGPCNNGLGNVILYDNRWRNYIDLWNDNYNWVIKGKVQTVDNVTPKFLK